MLRVTRQRIMLDLAKKNLLSSCAINLKVHHHMLTAMRVHHHLEIMLIDPDKFRFAFLVVNDCRNPTFSAQALGCGGTCI